MNLTIEPINAHKTAYHRHTKFQTGDSGKQTRQNNRIYDIKSVITKVKNRVEKGEQKQESEEAKRMELS